MLLAVYTGNLFGFSRGVRDGLEAIKGKKEASKEERSYLGYYSINEFIRKVWKSIVVVGLLLLCFGVFI